MVERVPDPDVQLVTFELEGEEYGVDVMQIREIITVPDITPSPTPKPEVEGMITLRGSVIPVISLRKKLGLPQIDFDLDTRIAITTSDGEEMGLILDRVSEVKRVKRSAIAPPADGMTQPWIAGVLKQEKLVVVMDLEKLGVV
jgi:purine-binding chemotaxis protein CheW